MNETLKILIIDDDEVDQLALCRALKTAGFSIDFTVSKTGKEGIEFLKTQIYDCVFLDYRLPDINGLKVLQEVRSLNISTPIVIFTAYGNEPIAVQLMQSGASDYIPKTLITPDGISQSVRNVIRIHQAEKELKESEEKYRDLFENANDLIQSVGIDGHFEYVNQVWKEVLGYREEEIASLTMFDIIHPNSHKHCQEVYKKVISGESVKQIEAVFVTKSGQEIIVEGNINAKFIEGKPVATRGIFRDITERKKIEESLIKSDARTQSILNNMSDALLTFSKEGFIESANCAAEKIFGYSKEEMINQHLNFLIPVDDISQKEFIQTVRDKALGRVVESRGKHESGNIFSLELLLFEFQTASTTNLAATIRDISEREEIALLKKEFISTISHELRTPLASIRGSLSLLTHGILGDLPEEAKEAICIAERNTLRLIDLINEILDLERLESGKVELLYKETSTKRILERAFETIDNVLKEFKVIVNSSSEINFCADEDRLIQVLVNLLTNATKFSHKHSNIEVSVKDKSGYVIFEIKDFGRGVPLKYQKSIFDRFQQVESSDTREKSGTGLGLAICKAIIDEHYGEIGVESEIEQGSLFWFRIPLSLEKKQKSSLV